MNINGEGISNSRFADAVLILSNSTDELKEMLQELDTQSKKAVLSMNTKKTKKYYLKIRPQLKLR